MQHQNKSMTTDRHQSEGTNATATPTPSPATQCSPHLMTGAERMLPREAYDALERKRTVCCNWGQPEDKVTDDKGVDIMVRVTATGTQDTTVCQENTQLDQTNSTSSETSAILNVTATPIQSPARQHPPCMMTRAECMLPREAYDALECKPTLHLYQRQPEDKETDDEGVDIRVRVTATRTQDTTVHQENTQLNQTNGTSSETTAVPNVRRSLIISLLRRGEPIVIDDNKIMCGICNKNIVLDKDWGHVISNGCKCNFDYHYEYLMRMQNENVLRKRNMKCSTSTCQKHIML
jgi:hypothetical protein